MKVLLIGTGNVATILGKLIKRSGHEIAAIAGRNAEAGLRLAESLDSKFIQTQQVSAEEADLYVISVSDAAVKDVAAQIHVPGKMVVHTAGAVPMNVLKETSQHYGVLYPLQSLRKEMEEIPEIPFILEGNNPENSELLRQFAASLSKRVEIMGDLDRAKLHVAAVFTSNFCNHLYDMAEQFCEAEKLDFNLLYPLIVETASRLKDHKPSNLQTGPASRKDVLTLEKHLRLLSNYPKLKTTYTRLTDSIMNP